MGVEVLAGRYALGDILATGGMAAVHLGLTLGHEGEGPVAIKRLHRHLVDQTEFVAMFLDEARLTKRLRHPHIVQTLDVVFGEHELFLVMEYLAGETLGELRRSARSRGIEIPIPIAARIVHDALEGLSCAHEVKDAQGKLLGVVHRDFSPANLMVGADGFCRLLDFGVAKAEGRLATTQEGSLKGKLAYMAPEQLLGTEVDHRADLFAVGLVLWELLAARKAYAGGDNDAALIARVIAPNFPPPSTLRTGVTPGLDAVALRALVAGREERWASAREMADALQAACEMASREAVSAFLEEVCGPALAARRALVAALPTAIGNASVEQAAVQPSPHDPARAARASAETLPDIEDPFELPKRRSIWPWLVGAGAALAIGLPLLALRGSDASASAPNGTGAARPTPPTAESSPLASASAPREAVAPPTASATADAVPPVASVAPPPTPPVPPPTSRPPPTTKKAGCAASPYTKGPGGILRVRPECL